MSSDQREHLNAREFYERGVYFRLFWHNEKETYLPKDDGFGKEATGELGRDWRGWDDATLFHELDPDDGGGMGWHRDGMLLWVDFDLKKSDEYTWKDIGTGFEPENGERIHVMSSKTPENVQVPLLVRGMDDDHRIASNFDWVDVKGGASATAPGYSVTPIHTEKYSFHWEDQYPDDFDLEGDVVPYAEARPGGPVEIDGFTALTLDGEPVLNNREITRGTTGIIDGNAGAGSVYEYLDESEYPVDSREPHPFHASSTGANFTVMPNKDEQMWTCWACDDNPEGPHVHGSLLHLMGMRYGHYECGDWYHMDPEEKAEVHRMVRARASEEGVQIERNGRSWHVETDQLHDTLEAARSGGSDRGALHRIRAGTEELLGEMMDGADSRSNGVVTSYPNSGKSFGFHKNLRGRDEGGTILQPNRELREETGRAAAEENDLDVFDLPSFPNDSPLMDEDSPQHDPRVAEWYNRGMPPRAIYEALGDEAPEAEDDPYRRKMSAEWGDTDLCVGDPVHAFLERAVEGRHVAMDDVDPYSSFVDEFHLHDERVRESVMGWLDHHRGDLLEAGVEVDTWDDVTKPDRRTRDAVLALADEHPSRECIPRTDSVTSDASRVARVLMTTSEDEPRAEWTEPAPYSDAGSGTKHTGARVGDHVIVAGLPLNLRDAETLLMLTATPVVPVFEQIFDDLRLSSGLYDSMDAEQRGDYFDDVLGATVVQTTRSSRFVSGGSNTRPSKLRQTVRTVQDLHDDDPVVVSSKKALEGPLSPVVDELGLETINFARAVGTNAFEGEELAIIWGAPHYGDDYVKRVASFCGDTGAEAIREDPETGERVETRWSTDTSQAIYDNMTEGTVFQAMLRVGRSSQSEATIYVETDKIPDDVPRYEPAGRDLLRMFTDKERECLDAMSALGTFTRGGLAESVTASRRTVYDVVERLEAEGVVEPAGRGAYGAEEYEMARDDISDDDEGAVPESVRSDLKDIIMARAHDLREVEPATEPEERVLTTRGGVMPLDPDAEAPENPQLDLAEFG